MDEDTKPHESVSSPDRETPKPEPAERLFGRETDDRAARTEPGSTATPASPPSPPTTPERRSPAPWPPPPRTEPRQESRPAEAGGPSPSRVPPDLNSEPARPAERPRAFEMPPAQQPRPASPLADAPTAAMPRLDPSRPPVSPRPVDPPRAPAAAATASGARAPVDTPTPKTAPTEQRGAVTVRRLRRGRLAIRKIDPWAVLKFSLVFYFCMLLIALLTVGILFATLKTFGVIDNLESLLRDMDFYVSITGGFIFRWLFLFGLVATVIASFVTMFMAFLYNLIADVVGGIELLVTERE